MDDVLGGEAAWKNVDSTQGSVLLFSSKFENTVDSLLSETPRKIRVYFE